MDEHTRSDAKERNGWKTQRRRALIAVALSGILVAAALMGWKLLGHRPPKPTDNPVSIAKFAATAEFAAMPDDQKVPYVRAIQNNRTSILAAANSGQLSREEKINAVRNVIRSRARMEMTAYHALPAGPARQALLDKLIDEQDRWRKHDGEQIEPNLVQMKQFVETLSPEERVRMASFAYDLIKRRQERSLPAWPFGGSEK